MKKTITTILLLAIYQFVNAQLIPEVYESPDIESYVEAHQSIAILPMDVTVRDMKLRVRKRLSDEEREQLEGEYSKEFQASVYDWMYKRHQKGKIKPVLQEPHITNGLLERQNIFTSSDLSSYPYRQIADMLGVDAIFVGRIITTSTFSKGGAIAMALILEEDVITGEADVSITLYDGPSAERVWSYNRVLVSESFNSPERLVKYMMKRVSRRFPY